jgi:hypothetical protein
MDSAFSIFASMKELLGFAIVNLGNSGSSGQLNSCGILASERRPDNSDLCFNEFGIYSLATAIHCCHVLRSPVGVSLNQEEFIMSRRSSNSRCQHSDAVSDPNITVVSDDAEDLPKPSLESLLASCGALQSVLRHEDDYSETMPECDSAENSLDPAEESSVEVPECEASTPEQELCSVPDEAPSVATGWLEQLRHEFRTSIEEIKSSQTAAAASQSAVLKTLTEIIFQSSSVRDSSEGSIDQKLSEFEDRLVSRITQMGGLPVEGHGRDLSRSSNSVPCVTESVKKNLARSWADIRNELVIQCENGGDGSACDQIEVHRSESELVIDDSSSMMGDCIDEVPNMIDPESLNEQELRAVFHEREEFITKLIGRLRHQHQKSSGHLPAEQLQHMAEHLPEELAEQVLQTLQQLNELARIGELELSLERARLARQVNQLDHSRQLIEHNARQIGLTLDDDGTLSNPQNLTLRNSGSRRWLSKLGFGP